jgi:L-threonylcarbamoyladenylate synthase
MNRVFPPIRVYADAILHQITELLASGSPLAYPTETLYALSCDATQATAVEHTHHIKGRSLEKSCALFIASPDKIGACLGIELNKKQYRFITYFSPGPITYIIQAGSSARVAPSLLRQDGTIGIRIPDHPVAQKILAAYPRPLLATSCNRAENPSLSSPQAIAELLPSSSLVVTGSPPPSGLASTVVDITGDLPKILRPGLLDIKTLLAMWDSV